MYTVTKQIIFPQKRQIELAALPDGSPQPPPPPVVVTLEIECETDEEVNGAAMLGEDVVRGVGKFLQGRVVFSRAARDIFNELYLSGLRVKAVMISPSPGFAVKYVPQVGELKDAAEEEAAEMVS